MLFSFRERMNGMLSRYLTSPNLEPNGMPLVPNRKETSRHDCTPCSEHERKRDSSNLNI